MFPNELSALKNQESDDKPNTKDGTVNAKKEKYMKKKKYKKPNVEWIPLDSKITLLLESEPPIGPDETFLQIKLFNNNPYKADISG